eukprot:CAMPEP_0176452278 /NCGR_PEP_ID=MMETSP0127-20121128/28424_1 /TAXON_ID=938130 /ORGANISM="Platyophrya macrostoma, Strain WH" /LENGTH=91 /DNA_ID=CAMNT_0017840669 /DNA_START=270 /DNA_END=541 /DNA_ORIENTATION=+
MRERYVSAEEDEAAMDEAIRQKREPTGRASQTGAHTSSPHEKENGGPAYPDGSDEVSVDELRRMPEAARQAEAHTSPHEKENVGSAYPDGS